MLFSCLDVHMNVQKPFATCDVHSLWKPKQPRERPPSFYANTRGPTPQVPNKWKHTSGSLSGGRQLQAPGLNSTDHITGTKFNQLHSTDHGNIPARLMGEADIWKKMWACGPEIVHGHNPPWDSLINLSPKTTSRLPALQPQLCSSLALSGEARTTYP